MLDLVISTEYEVQGLWFTGLYRMVGQDDHAIRDMRRQHIKDAFSPPTFIIDDHVAGLSGDDVEKDAVAVSSPDSVRHSVEQGIVIGLALLQLEVAPHQLHRPVLDPLFESFGYRLEILACSPQAIDNERQIGEQNSQKDEKVCDQWCGMAPESLDATYRQLSIGTLDEPIITWH